MSNRCIADLDAQILAVPLEGATGELGLVVSDDPIWDPKPIDDWLNELDSILLVDFYHLVNLSMVM
jgi:hypothetical protein